MHLEATKRILHYIKGTITYGHLYSVSNEFRLVGYSDSNWGGNLEDKKSTIDFTFFISNMAFTWFSKKQPIVALSTCEAEYVVASSYVGHAIWLRNLLKAMHHPQYEATKIMVDNRLAIALAKNPIFHERSKHIDVRFHFIRDQVKKEV